MRALMFDFFGTLVEYQPDRSRLGSPLTYELASSMGFAGDHKGFVRIWDAASLGLEQAARHTMQEFSMTDAANAFGAAAGIPLSHDLAVALGQSFVTEWAQHITPIDGASDLIRHLAEEYTIAVVSNTHDSSMVPNMLDKMGIEGHVSAVVLSVEHGRLKPHPSIYAAALDRIGCPAAEVAFVGDSYEADYSGPLQAGMSAFLVDPAFEHDIPALHRLTSVLDIVESMGRGEDCDQ
ncbi:MAG: HAD family hydrolase [Ilumatobacter sp.]|uniref:HAD family hydrolase n=1 Tax=Ilumatobacter sp. TaxID=1967498 RepID=UPI00391B2D99